MPLRILHLIASRGFYGAERVTAQLCNSLAARGHSVTLALLTEDQPALLETFRMECEPQVCVVGVACRGRVDLRALWQIRRLLRTKGADLLHSHGYKADAYGFVATRFARVPIVATCHNWTARDRSLRAYRALDQRILRRFDGCVAVSGYVAEQLVQAGVPPVQVQVIANGIDAKAMRDIACAPNGPTIGALSRLSWEKGLDVLVRALPLIQQEFPQVRCTLAGDGPERARLERMAEELGATSSLSMPGFLPTEELLKTSRVFVLPSRTEGTPMGLLEAMAAARPIVAAAVGGVPRILQHERSGLLVPPDDPVALAQAIVRMLRDAEAAGRMGIRAREHVQAHFSLDVMTDRYMRLYGEVVQRHKKCSASIEPELEKVQG